MVCDKIKINDIEKNFLRNFSHRNMINNSKPVMEELF